MDFKGMTSGYQDQGIVTVRQFKKHKFQKLSIKGSYQEYFLNIFFTFCHAFMNNDA
jgi:hypothetical protein